MTPSHEPNGPLTPTDEAIVDTWFARQHQDTGINLAAMLDLHLSLQDILLAGHHRDMGADLAGALDLDTGLAAILPSPARTEPPPIQFDNLTDLLDWISTAPTLRLTHRNRLRRLAIDTEILHPTSARDLDHDRDHARDLDHALAIALDHARDLALALDHDLDHDLDRPRARDLARDLDRARDLALAHDRAVAHDLDRARDLALALDRDLDYANGLARARALARALALALCGTVVRLGVGDLVRAISDQASVDTSWLKPATIGAREAARLHELCTDFTGVDLHEAQLSGLYLIGVRWSRTTRWPPADVDWIVAASEPVGNGVYVIREAAANGGAVVVPDPVSV